MTQIKNQTENHSTPNHSSSNHSIPNHSSSNHSTPNNSKRNNSKYNNSKHKHPSAPSFKTAQGKIPYGMTNDYMFRAVLQSNNKVLRGLICAVLHLKEKDIRKVEITNTIILGEAIGDKEIRLDINVNLNDNTNINLEMQMANELNWHNRSVMYLGRSFDQLNRGQGYNEIKPVIHIGFLNYTLFEEYPEFYATYKLLNVKNHHVYSDNITLSVVDLTRIDLATKEDKEYQIDKWAALFKAKTWEELKMIAEKNVYLNEASKTMYQMSTDEQIRKWCRDREEYYLDLRAIKKEIAKDKKVIAEKDNTIAEKDCTIAEKDNTIAKQQNELAKNAAIIEQLRAENELLKKHQ